MIDKFELPGMLFLLKQNDRQWHSIPDEFSHVLQPKHVLLILAHHVLMQPAVQCVENPQTSSGQQPRATFAETSEFAIKLCKK